MRGRFISWVIAFLLIVLGFAKPFAGRVNAAPPIAYDSAFTLYEDHYEPFAITLTATDADGDPLTLTIITPPAHGTLSGNPHYDLTYEPDEDYNGMDSFVFSASDGTNSDTGTVTLTITPVDDTPRVTDPDDAYEPGYPMLTRSPGVPLIMDGAPGNLEPFVVYDIDDTVLPLRVSLYTPRPATATLSRTNGLTFTLGDGTADGSMEFYGSYADVNAALDGLIFSPSAGAQPGTTTGLDISARDPITILSNSAGIHLTVDPPFEDHYVVNGTLEACDANPRNSYHEVIQINRPNGGVVRVHGTLPDGGKLFLTGNTPNPFSGWGLDWEFDNPETAITYNAPSMFYLIVMASEIGDYSLEIDGTDLTMSEPWNCNNETLYPSSLTLEIGLQGRPAPPHPQWAASVNIDISSGGEFWFLHPGQLDEYGRITIDPLPVDATTNIIIAESGTFLLSVQDVPVAPGANYFYAGVLRAGDADNNGRVDLLDFSRLAGAFGTSTGHPRFNPNTDFNGDGLISLLDFSLLALNYGATVD